MSASMRLAPHSSVEKTARSRWLTGSSRGGAGAASCDAWQTTWRRSRAATP